MTLKFECSKGHCITSPKSIDRCPAYHLGSPCPGTVKQVGHGSRKAAS